MQIPSWLVSSKAASAAGVRHLVWDFGKGFEPKTADMTGWAVIVFGVVAAVLIWIVAYLTTGAPQ